MFFNLIGLLKDVLIDSHKLHRALCTVMTWVFRNGKVTALCKKSVS